MDYLDTTIDTTTGPKVMIYVRLYLVIMLYLIFKKIDDIDNVINFVV